MNSPRSVLVVDDEPMMQQLLEHTLKSQGYTVFVAGGAEEALATLKREKIDLLLTDFTMPKANGFELINQARAENAKLLAVVMTGNGDDFKNAPAGVEILRKPFRRQQLTEVLDSTWKRAAG